MRALLGEATPEPPDEEGEGGGKAEELIVVVCETKSAAWPAGTTGKMLKEVAKVREGWGSVKGGQKWEGRVVCQDCCLACGNDGQDAEGGGQGKGGKGEDWGVVIGRQGRGADHGGV